MEESDSAPRDGGRKLTGKRILVVLYSHMDWAWCASRQWHVARYVRIFDEVLELAGQNPELRFCMDSLAEGLEPYFALRPDALPAWRRLVEQGRVALCGGHYANIRPATAPEETYIRNLQLGREQLSVWFPDLEPHTFANLDTAIGHSQLPQVLALAGFGCYLAGRPELGMELDGMPKMFRWQGLDGSQLITCVQHYGILCGPFAETASQDPDKRRKARDTFVSLLEAHADAPVDTLYAFYGMDDTRPGRDHISDEFVDMNAIIAEWNRTEDSEMSQATPEDLFRSLQRQSERLPVVEGTVDHADVGYNGPFSQASLRPLRDQAAARLVEAEMLAAFAAPTGGDCPGEALAHAWRAALRAQSHAVQFLFAEDVDAMRLNLLDAVRTADDIRTAATACLLPTCLSQDATSVTVVSTCPHSRQAIIRIPLLRTDFQVPGFALCDEKGDLLPQQAVDVRNPARRSEWDVLVQLQLPGCGLRTLQVTDSPAPPVFCAPTDLPATGTTAAGPWQIQWQERRITRISGRDTALEADDSTSILEPVCYGAEMRGWMTTSITARRNHLVFDTLRQTEAGPLRWRYQRSGMLSGHHVRQDLCVYVDGRIECTTEINHGVDACYFGLALPCRPGSRMDASIPFGVEERKLDDVTYCSYPQGDRIIERLVPGMFYARDWVRLLNEREQTALVALDGDRYWYRRPGENALVHLLLRAMKPVAEGWERFAEMDRAGCMSFRHALCLGSQATEFEALNRTADSVRFPTRTAYTREEGRPATETLMTVSPANMRLLACRRVGDEIELRLVESAGQRSSASIELAWPVSEARLTDLRGRTIDGTVRIAPNRISFESGAWQIRNLRLTIAPRAMEKSTRQ